MKPIHGVLDEWPQFTVIVIPVPADFIIKPKNSMFASDKAPLFAQCAGLRRN
jgi:hypothetical protein